MAPPLIVLDTNVVTAAVMGSPISANSRIIDEVATGAVRLALSDDYFDELVRTMSDPRVEENASVGRAVRVALVLAYMGRPYRPRKHDWPSIPDRKDWWILDLALESEADHIVTWDTRHLTPARALGFDVLNPPAFLALLPA